MHNETSDVYTMNILKKKYTTIDVESNLIRVLDIHNASVQHYGEVKIHPDYLAQGVILNPEQVSSELSTLMKHLNSSRQNVLVSMNCFRLITRFVTMPLLQGGDLKEAVKWALVHDIPVPLDTINVWWNVVEKNGNEQKVLIIGVPREALAALYTTLYYAGITPRAIDIKAIALTRVVKEETAIIIDIEDETTSMIFKSGGIPVVAQTIHVKPSNAEIEDRLSLIQDELSRMVLYYNGTHPEKLIGTDTPVCLTGGLADTNVETHFIRITQHPIIRTEAGLAFPDELPPGTYMVNFGLYLREDKERRTLLYPDISRAVRFRK